MADISAENTEDFVPELTGKKKKKKGVVFDDQNEQPAADQGTPAAAADDLGEFDLGKKKKKSKKVAVVEGEDAEGSGGAEETADYTYEELLNRVFNIMRDKNPEMVTGDKKKFIMRPPEVARAGSKKSAFVNFADICKILKRQPKHLLAFLLAELGTSGSIDGSNQLIIKGRFQQKHIENVLRKYIKEYVTCHTCKSADTLLQKDTRLFFLQCETCGSRCSVASIKTGFQALTTKRAVVRNAAVQQAM